MKKLEITKKLEDLRDRLFDEKFVAVLNLPGPNYCEKRAELSARDGVVQQSCKGCVTQGLGVTGVMPDNQIRQAIDYFAENYDTQFVTVNGRGDPLHPNVRGQTFLKLQYGRAKGMQGYIFSAGNNLDYYVCKLLADNEVNIMLSLFGNRFIDADFFSGKEYPSAEGRMQDQATIAENIRNLLGTYKEYEKRGLWQTQPEAGTTRIGMNYPVQESDLKDRRKLSELKQAANENGVFFVCNTEFVPHADSEIQRQLRELAYGFTDFHISHSTGVDGQCQMGAGSSATVDYNGTLYRCPYMSGPGEGNFFSADDNQRRKILTGYLKDREYACVMRKTPLVVR